MKIPECVSNACTATANAVSSFYGWGCSTCSSLTTKVAQVAGRFIPTAVSNIVKAYPKSFGVAVGIAGTLAIVGIASRLFPRQTPPPSGSKTV